MDNKTYKMKHFTHGKLVMYDGYEYRVDYVAVRGFDLYVHLQNKSGAVHSDNVFCEPTTFLLERQLRGSE